jgi:hypothetical protein
MTLTFLQLDSMVTTFPTSLSGFAVARLASYDRNIMPLKQDPQPMRYTFVLHDFDPEGEEGDYAHLIDLPRLWFEGYQAHLRLIFLDLISPVPTFLKRILNNRYLASGRCDPPHKEPISPDNLSTKQRDKGFPAWLQDALHRYRFPNMQALFKNCRRPGTESLPQVLTSSINRYSLHNSISPGPPIRTIRRSGSRHQRRNDFLNRSGPSFGRHLRPGQLRSSCRLFDFRLFQASIASCSGIRNQM